MSTYTVPAGVDVPSAVGATIHLAVPGERVTNAWGVDMRTDPPPVLAALVQKKCETCKGSSLDLSPESIMRTFAKRMDGAPPGSVGVDDCPDCAGSGSELLDLVRVCHANHLIDSHEPLCNEAGHLSSGRWKVEALDADDKGGYVATLTLVVAP